MSLTSREIVIYFALKYHGEYQAILDAISKREKCEEQEVREVLSTLKSNVVTIVDPEYPWALKEIFKPPLALFYKGDISLLNEYLSSIAIVGAREPTPYAQKHLEELMNGIAPKYVVVSGCAVGVDAMAQSLCIKNGGRTIGVLGCGFDYVYPKENAALIEEIATNHLLISEYPDNTQSKAENFVMRNRIIIGLSRSALVFDVKERSGTLSSVTHATSCNRDILTIPYPPGTKFLNNAFIKEGCYLVDNIDDIDALMKK